MIKYKTDWLASKPVFYNQKTLKISYNINDVIDWSNIEFHPEGLNNYLDFGYSVFEQTPLKNIKFLRYSSEIYIKNKKLIIKEFPDPIEQWFEKHKEPIYEEDVLKLIKEKINKWEKGTKGNIIIPTSGGYDSRLLNYFVNDKSRIRAFTYGVSDRQKDSYEVVYAKRFCEKLNIDWKQIELGDFHKYFDNWDNLFGISTHAHGMYHVEFYTKIKKLSDKEENLLSGIVGDIWAGSIEKQNILSYKDLIKLGYTHGLGSNSRFSRLKGKETIKKEYFLKNRENLSDIRFQTVTTVRLKMILLSYLMRLPESFNFKPWSPYLDMDTALSMLSIDMSRREKRRWQKDFFKESGLNPNRLGFKKNKFNNLNHKAMERIKLKPLNVDLLSEIINETYVEYINDTLFNTIWYFRIIPRLYKIKNVTSIPRLIVWILKKLGIGDEVLKMYYAYLTLKPIENVLYRRDKYLKEKNK